MRKSIINKVLPILVILILVLAGIFVIIIHQVITSNFETENLERIQGSKHSFDSITNEEMRLLKAGIISISSDDKIKAAFVSRDRDLLYDRTKDIYSKAKEEIGLTHWNFHTADDVLFLRVHSPDLFGEKSSDRYTAKMAMDTKSWGYGLEVGSRGYALRMVGPYTDNGNIIGYIEQGVEIGPFLEIMKNQTGDDYAIFGLKNAFDPKKWKESRESKKLRNNYDDMADYVLLGSTDTPFIEENLPLFSVEALHQASDTGNIFSTFSADNKNYLTGGFNLVDGRGEVVGVVTVIHDVTDHVKETNQTLLSLIIIAIVITIITAGILIIRIHQVIIRPIRTLTTAAAAMGEGEILTEIAVHQDDEIGQLARSFATLEEGLKGKSMAAAAIAQGTFDFDIPVLSDRDSLGHSMAEMKRAVMDLTDNVRQMATAAEQGNLTEGKDPALFHGTYQDIIISMNSMLEAIVTPLQEVLRVSDLFAQGRFSTRFDESVETKGDLIALKEGLNTVGHELSLVIGEIDVEVTDMNASTEQTAASIEEVSAGAQSIAQSSARVCTIAENTANSIEIVLHSMDEFTTSVSQVAVKVSQVHQLTQNVSNITKEGMAKASVAEDGIQSINGAVHDAGSIISAFRQQTDEIGKIVGIISAIADQTNLLALNASIEAARAGNAGLGFAVVANEVKTLAQESQGSAETIASIIRSLQHQSELAESAMQKATGEVERGSEAITNTIHFFNTIAEEVFDISQNMTEVSLVTEKEADAVQEMESRIHEVKGLADSTSQEAIASAAAAEESSVALNQISTIMADLSLIAARIQESVGRLKS